MFINKSFEVYLLVRGLSYSYSLPRVEPCWMIGGEFVLIYFLIDLHKITTSLLSSKFQYATKTSQQKFGPYNFIKNFQNHWTVAMKLYLRLTIIYSRILAFRNQGQVITQKQFRTSSIAL